MLPLLFAFFVLGLCDPEQSFSSILLDNQWTTDYEPKYACANFSFDLNKIAFFSYDHLNLGVRLGVANSQELLLPPSNCSTTGQSLSCRYFLRIFNACSVYVDFVLSQLTRTTGYQASVQTRLGFSSCNSCNAQSFTLQIQTGSPSTTGSYYNPPSVNPPSSNYYNPPSVSPPSSNYYNPPPSGNYYNPPSVSPPSSNYYNPPPSSGNYYQPPSSNYYPPPSFPAPSGNYYPPPSSYYPPPSYPSPSVNPPSVSPPSSNYYNPPSSNYYPSPSANPPSGNYYNPPPSGNYYPAPPSVNPPSSNYYNPPPSGNYYNPPPSYPSPSANPPSGNYYNPPPSGNYYPASRVEQDESGDVKIVESKVQEHHSH